MSPGRDLIPYPGRECAGRLVRNTDRASRGAVSHEEEKSVRSIVVALLCLILMTVCASAFAAETGGLMGRSELMGAAAWMGASVAGEDFSGVLFGANYGKFYTPNLEVQLGAIYGRMSAFDEDVDALLLGPAAVYHFVPKDKKTATLPYLG